jgi:hypothetical protein
MSSVSVGPDSGIYKNNLDNYGLGFRDLASTAAAWGASGGPKRRRRVAALAMSTSGGPRRERRDDRDGPRRERWWLCLPEARVVVAMTFWGASGDGCGDPSWWHPKTTISSDAAHRRASSEDHLGSDGLWGILWPGGLGIVRQRRTIKSMFIPLMIMFYARYLHYLCI